MGVEALKGIDKGTLSNTLMSVQSNFVQRDMEVELKNLIEKKLDLHSNEVKRIFRS